MTEETTDAVPTETAGTEPQQQGMTLQQHAMQELNAVEAGLADLETKYKGVVFDVSTTKGMEEAKKARLEIRAPRYKAQNIAKETASQLAAISRSVKAGAENITTRIAAIEAPIHEQIEAEETRKENERAAKQAAKDAEQAAIRGRLDNIRNLPLNAISANAEELQLAIDALTADNLEGFDDVWLPDAQQAKQTALEALGRLLATRTQLDREAAALEAQRAEQEAREAEAAQAQAERDEAERQAREKEEADRQARARVDEHIADLWAIPSRAGQLDAEALQATLTETQEIRSNHPRFGERQADAQAAIDAVVQTLTGMLNNKRESDRVAAEQAERQAELDAQEAAAAAERQQRQQEESQQREADAQREREAQAESDLKAEVERQAAAALAERRARIKLVVTMPDGSRWAVPARVIVGNCHATMINTKGAGEATERALELFDDAEALQDWAANNMNWYDVVEHAEQVTPPAATDYQEGWVNGDKEVVGMESQP